MAKADKGVKVSRRVRPDEEAANGDVVVQLATRIPKSLARELKLYAVGANTSISDLVSRYITSGLKADRTKKAA